MLASLQKPATRARERRCEPFPSPCLVCGLGQARAGSPCRMHAAFLSSRQPPPRRARSKVLAPAISAASFLAICSSCGAPLADLRKWLPECRPAPPWAVRTARCSLACVLAACPSAREHTLYAHAKVAQPGGPGASVLFSFLQHRENPFVVVVCGHTLLRAAPQSRFVA